MNAEDRKAMSAARRQKVLNALARLGGWQPCWRIAKECGYGIRAASRALSDLRSERLVERREDESVFRAIQDDGTK